MQFGFCIHHSTGSANWVILEKVIYFLDKSACVEEDISYLGAVCILVWGWSYGSFSIVWWAHNWYTGKHVWQKCVIFQNMRLQTIKQLNWVLVFRMDILWTVNSLHCEVVTIQLIVMQHLWRPTTTEQKKKMVINAFIVYTSFLFDPMKSPTIRKTTYTETWNQPRAE